MNENETWLARWQAGRIGFHEGHPNTFLERHGARLGAGRRVLVPLCGKSVDLAFLAARGHAVVGIELAELAVQAFFQEHGLTPDIERRGALVQYQSRGLTLFAGDVFDATPALLGRVDALYDRAALVALPPELRRRYVQQLRALLPSGAKGLVITFEYDQERMSGPPFSVPETELRSLYAGQGVALVEDAPARGLGKLATSGVPALERCFEIDF